MNVNVRHLAAFAAAARLGSFTKAARALYISQPSFTAQIKQLEGELGVRLLDRNTRTVSMTAIGRDLAPVVERLLGELEAIVANTRALSAKTVGSVTIAALPSVSATLLPGVIAAFRQKYPGIRFRLRDAIGKRIVEMTLNDEVDFGIGSADVPGADVRFEPLFTDWMCAVLPAGSRLKRKKALQLRELISEPLILTGPDSTVRQILDHAFSQLGHAVVPVQEVTYMSTALGMVKAGLGIAILTSSALELDEMRTLRAVPIDHSDLYRVVGIIQKPNRSLSPAAKSFLESVQQACAERIKAQSG
jgi:DNA-binding transcriptional LysR family regulator